MFTGLIYVLNVTKEYNRVKLILETPAGQGTELCSNIEELGYFITNLNYIINTKTVLKYALIHAICLQQVIIFQLKRYSKCF